jgi:hypothetical protein
VFRPWTPEGKEPRWDQVVSWCREPWTRTDPLVGEGGTCGGDDQISDSYTAQWTAPLSDGTFAVVTSYFYLVERDGRVFIERQDEYLTCRDLAAPGDTEIESEAGYHEVPCDEPEREDLVALVAGAADPEPGEYDHYLPRTPMFLWD